jgi:hypothetical protein
MRTNTGSAGASIQVAIGVYIASAIVFAILGLWAAAIVFTGLAVVFAIVRFRASLATARERLSAAELLLTAPDGLPRIGTDQRAL